MQPPDADVDPSAGRGKAAPIEGGSGRLIDKSGEREQNEDD